MINRRKPWLLIFLFAMSVSYLQAQHGFSLVYAPSKVIKHRKTLRFDVPTLTHEWRLAYTFQTNGRKDWQIYWKQPRVAINGLYMDFGDRNVLGRAYAILPEMHFTLARWQKLKLNLQFGTGVAYLDRPYNELKNPKNNAIGSNFNNVTSLKFGIDYQWSHRLSTTLSTGMVHFSNGKSATPNIGINTYGLSIGLIYDLVNDNKDETYEILKRERTPQGLYKKWVIDAQFQYGFTQQATPGGPQYGVPVCAIGIGWRYTRYLTVSFGGSYEFNSAIYQFMKNSFFDEQSSKKAATKTSIFIENELRYNQFFNRLQYGYYLNWPSEPDKKSYLKIMTGAYLPIPKIPIKPYIGIVLKTHIAIADYLAIMVGAQF